MTGASVEDCFDVVLEVRIRLYVGDMKVSQQKICCDFLKRTGNLYE